jgi:hypothetical protein
LIWGGEVDGGGGVGVGHVGVEQDVRGIGHVVFGEAVGVGDHEVAEGTEFFEGTGFGEEPVVGDDVGIGEGKGDFFAGLGGELFLDELETEGGFDGEFATAVVLGPGVGF